MKSNQLLFKKNYEAFKHSIWKNKEKASNIWNNAAWQHLCRNSTCRVTPDQIMFFQLNCADPEVPSNIRNTFIYSVHLNVCREHTTEYEAHACAVSESLYLLCRLPSFWRKPAEAWSYGCIHAPAWHRILLSSEAHRRETACPWTGSRQHLDKRNDPEKQVLLCLKQSKSVLGRSVCSMFKLSGTAITTCRVREEQTDKNRASQ